MNLKIGPIKAGFGRGRKISFRKDTGFIKELYLEISCSMKDQEQLDTSPIDQKVTPRP